MDSIKCTAAAENDIWGRSEGIISWKNHQILFRIIHLF